MINSKCFQIAVDTEFSQHVAELASLFAAMSVQADQLAVPDKSRVAENIGVIAYQLQDIDLEGVGSGAACAKILIVPPQ